MGKDSEKKRIKSSIPRDPGELSGTNIYIYKQLFSFRFEGAVFKKIFFLALPASVWSKNKGGGRALLAPPLDPPWSN